MKIETIFTVIIGAFLLVLMYSNFTNAFGWHTDEYGTTNYLTKRGYTDIRFLPFKMITPCPKGTQWYRTRFIAKNKEGVKVVGCLCEGWIDSGKILMEQ